ncbi:hypothetical protein BGZ61DRAFT_526811 [Ilyonectria robusta]|uniref:uncharacterized protein n=1 Tax=Ilyonectria robusta TaxID=1079257 RepID=UPI001E8E16AB|nr:uncharacterized protein BGZ61DRAFT_526811 [Ilyonectria robusta]KAH8735774.1 hypothetical protein BGZ61DRAFT_526811 [Ilyonectria robusta]
MKPRTRNEWAQATALSGVFSEASRVPTVGPRELLLPCSCLPAEAACASGPRLALHDRAHDRARALSMLMPMLGPNARLCTSMLCNSTYSSPILERGEPAAPHMPAFPST